jgi:hypothetical protein
MLLFPSSLTLYFSFFICVFVHLVSFSSCFSFDSEVNRGFMIKGWNTKHSLFYLFTCVTMVFVEGLIK